MYSYGSNQPLQVAGTFTAEVSIGERVLSGVEFVVGTRAIPCPKNIADSLSHLLHPVPQSRDQNKTEEYVKWVAQESMPVALTTVKLREHLNMTHS